MIWVIANEVDEDGSFPTFRHYKKAFKKGEIDIYCAKQYDDFSFLKKDDIAFIRTRNENINWCVADAQRRIGFKSTLESPITNLLTHDKELVKSLLETNGISYPRSYVVNEFLDGIKCFVKPRYGENSVGVDEYSICSNLTEIDVKFRQLKNLVLEPMVEEYIEGNEVTVAVISSNGSLSPEVYQILVEPYNYCSIHTDDVKREFRFKAIRYENEYIRMISNIIFDVIGAKHMLRIDFRINDGIPYVIDINMIPGLAPNGYMARCLKAHGINYYTFIQMLVNTAN